jgi:hypothetical protein
VAAQPVFSSVPAQRSDTTAATLLSVVLLAAAVAFACWLIGARPQDVGTDTDAYASFFDALRQGLFETRLEPGFVYLSYGLNRLGLGITGFQTALFLFQLLTVLVATRKFQAYLGAGRGYLTLLSAALMLLFVSPMFVNGAINAVRQGMAALLVFTALLLFRQRQWWQFLFYGALASSLHYSSLLYLAFAPVLLLPRGLVLVVAIAAFLAYASGASMALVQALAPRLYGFVMEYTANVHYSAGVRIDFAVFSIFWYALPLLLAPMVRADYRQRIKDSTSIYLVMLLPFFAVGWGYFSNRYLLPAWLSVSLILAAVLCHNRIGLLRDPVLIRIGLVVSCAVLYVLVSNEIVI